MAYYESAALGLLHLRSPTLSRFCRTLFGQRDSPFFTFSLLSPSSSTSMSILSPFNIYHGDTMYARIFSYFRFRVELTDDIGSSYTLSGSVLNSHSVTFSSSRRKTEPSKKRLQSSTVNMLLSTLSPKGRQCCRQAQPKSSTMTRRRVPPNRAAASIKNERYILLVFTSLLYFVSYLCQ